MQRIAIALLTLISILASSTTQAAPAGWGTDVEVAFEQAAKSDRMVLVDLYADWCGWCKVLERKVFATSEFKSFAKDFVLLHVDVEDGGQGTELQARYGAGTLPTILILTPDQAKAGTIQGFHPTAELIDLAKQELDRYKAFLSFYEKHRTSDNLATLQRLAETLHGQSDGLRAAVVYKQVGQLVPEGSKADAWVHYMLADAHRLSRSWQKATAAVTAARDLAIGAGNLELTERIELLSYQIARDGGDCVTAKTTLEKFLRDHPNSSRSDTAERALSLLQSGNDARCT